MSIDEIKNQLPAYAKDLKLNLSNLASDESLSEQQLWGTFVATAMAGRNTAVINAVLAEASEHLSAEALEAAKGAAAIMGMNNVYYKFVGMIDADDYKTMPAQLRMNIIGNPGVDKDDFELWSLAVSAQNGCQYCVNAHEGKLVAAGISKKQIQTAVRIASVVQAVSLTLDTEYALVAGGAAQSVAA